MSHYQAQAYCPIQSQTSYLADIVSDEEFKWLLQFVNISTWVNKQIRSKIHIYVSINENIKIML